MAESRCNNSTSAAIDSSVEYARGAFKKVYKGKYTEGSRTGQPCVSKVFISGSVFENSYFQHEMDVVKKATEIVRAFNGLELINKRIVINQPEIWVFRDSQALTLIEPLIENFEKFNSNSGWTQDTTSWGQAMQALAHYSFHYSNGQLTLCDLQGGVYSDGIVLTDPVVMSTDRRFGPTDLGKDGIALSIQLDDLELDSTFKMKDMFDMDEFHARFLAATIRTSNYQVGDVAWWADTNTTTSLIGVYEKSEKQYIRSLVKPEHRFP
ncbi:hypothetical protein BGX20_002107 [Mortierella sp. AD010]|nr:hypothetical protein BGX20_002107 [Mortierella sp. AD010]